MNNPIIGKYDVCDECGPTVDDVHFLDPSQDFKVVSRLSPDCLLICDSCLWKYD